MQPFANGEASPAHILDNAFCLPSEVHSIPCFHRHPTLGGSLKKGKGIYSLFFNGFSYGSILALESQAYFFDLFLFSPTSLEPLTRRTNCFLFRQNSCCIISLFLQRLTRQTKSKREILTMKATGIVRRIGPRRHPKRNPQNHADPRRRPAGNLYR